MAFQIHIARTAALNVDGSGNVVNKDDPNVTIGQALATELQHRVLADSTIPNTASQPTVKAYLEAEANIDYVLEYMDQNTVVTYLRTAGDGFGFV